MVYQRPGARTRRFEEVVGSAVPRLRQAPREQPVPQVVVPAVNELTEPVTKERRGRPRKHRDNAAKQKAYRDRNRPEPKAPLQPPYGSESQKDWNTYLARVEKLSVHRGKFMPDAPQGKGLLIYGHSYQESSEKDREDAEENYQGQPNLNDQMSENYYYEERPDADDLPGDD